MKELFMLEVRTRLAPRLTPEQLAELDRVLGEELEGKELYWTDPQEKRDVPGNSGLVELFLSAKRTEGCSARTIGYYGPVLSDFAGFCAGTDIRLADADFIRSYLAGYQGRNGCGNTTMDNIRRDLSSFYSWLEAEDRIVKSPVRRIHKIKTPREKKEPFSEEETERLRKGCSGNKRDEAIMELLLSSGIRVGELVTLDKADIDLGGRTGKVRGKGSKERAIYFNVRTRMLLKSYLDARDDDSPALFVSRRSYVGRGGHTRVSINAVETMVRRAGEDAGVARAHPHRFRRTFATRALDKGMPIELVQVLLGHTKIDTTLMYAIVQQHNVRAAHEKYVC